jgi:DNA polymerase III alpha subunit
MPDVDIDFDERRRVEVIRYVTEKYGADKVAMIGTYGKNEPDVKKVIDTAKGVEGLVRQMGVHAAGVIMSSETITEHVPVWVRHTDGVTITQWDYPSCKSLGLLKMDFLGLRNLTIMDDAINEEPLEEVLAVTYGLIVYQEQVQKAAQIIAGYSLGEADILRRVMGKKKPDELAKNFTIFQAGAQKNGYSDEAIQALRDVLAPFAGYAFNKAHSAAYGLVSYWTA